MDKLFISLQASNLVEFFFDEIFYGLHIVVGHLLDVFYTLCACLVKGGVDVTQTWEQVVVERCELWEW